jgi:hypothetical protein
VSASGGASVALSEAESVSGDEQAAPSRANVVEATTRRSIQRFLINAVPPVGEMSQTTLVRGVFVPEGPPGLGCRAYPTTTSPVIEEWILQK